MQNEITVKSKSYTNTVYAEERSLLWRFYAICYDHLYKIMPYRRLLWDCLQALDLKPGDKILILGSGLGHFERFLKEKNINDIYIEAIEPSQNRRRIAKQRHIDSELSNSGIQGMSPLPYINDSFDKLLCLNLLNKADNSSFLISELCRIIKISGKMVFIVPQLNTQNIGALWKEHKKHLKNVLGLVKKTKGYIKTILAFLAIALGNFLLRIKQVNLQLQYTPKKSLEELFNKVSVKFFLRDDRANHKWFIVCENDKNVLDNSHMNIEFSTLQIPVTIEKSSNYEGQNAVFAVLKAVTMPFINVLPEKWSNTIFTAFSNDTKKVKENIANFMALETMYTLRTRVKVKKANLADYFWETFLSNARAVRNRLQLAEKELDKAISDIAANGREVKILSLGAGSARAIIKNISDQKKQGNTNIQTLLLDINPKALEYSKKLAQEFGVENHIKVIRGSVKNVNKYCGNFRPNVVEIVGLLDYFDERLAIKILTDVYELMEPSSWLIACNIDENKERKFVTDTVGWDMIYRSYKELSTILLNSGFTSKNLVFYYEPLKIHVVSIAKKDALHLSVAT